MKLGLSFQLNKVSRFIKLYGNDFVFERYQLNKFKEPIKDDPQYPPQTITVSGVYHEVSSQVTFSASEGTVVRSKPQPQILCMPEDGRKVRSGDVVEYKGLRYKVVEPVNPGMQDVCVDISLEVIQDG